MQGKKALKPRKERRRLVSSRPEGVCSFSVGWGCASATNCTSTSLSDIRLGFFYFQSYASKIAVFLLVFKYGGSQVVGSK